MSDELRAAVARAKLNDELSWVLGVDVLIVGFATWRYTENWLAVALSVMALCIAMNVRQVAPVIALALCGIWGYLAYTLTQFFQASDTTTAAAVILTVFVCAGGHIASLQLLRDLERRAA